jgi:hypothetical protein
MGLAMADVTIVGGAARAGADTTISESQRDILAWTLASIAMVFALMAPALWNGFPIIFPDTGGYLDRPILGTLGMGRSALYGVFLYAGSPFAFWPNVILQSAMIAWLIVLTLRVHGLGQRPWLALGIVTLLTISSSLPWLSGQLMPDILFPAAILALHLLIFRNDQLVRWERFALAGVIALAIPSHMAAAGMCVAVIAALWLLSRVNRLALPQPRLSFAAGAVAAGIALCPVTNLAITGQFAFTPGGESFLFGRLLEDGIVARYLDDRCPDPTLKLCPYKVGLPDEADDWLWGNDTPFYRLGGWKDYADEEREIILATLKRYPLMQATTAVADTFDQFISFNTEISFEDNDPTLNTLADRTPKLVPQLMSARQQARKFDVDAINMVHVPVAALAIAGLGVALIFRGHLKIAPEFIALCTIILLALAANAAICGVFSHAVDRYQSRLVPLALFAVILLAADGYRARLPAGGPVSSRAASSSLGTPAEVA